MEPALNDLTDKALSLPIDQRITLAQKLWDSIEGFVDPDIEKAWLDEAEKRWHEIENGSVECIPAEQAMKTVRDRLNLKR